ncbi:protein phosphatase 2C family protein [Actinidia rufa]|uniref:Protein phosphatase n=1 Tax=Actinidia rufa TaxID=165716 RepID=A0A7J0EI47_9ERIC|nr:protein phosphatase 2C family protein [Actinidia rufa]
MLLKCPLFTYWLITAGRRKDLAGRTLKLISGLCYLPHPDNEETGGEDAHFICADEQAIVDAIQDEPMGDIDPARVLEKAHLSTKDKGYSTACIIALTDQNWTYNFCFALQSLHAINLGDSGFIVVRDGCTIFRSLVQQHHFNFTYQLEGENSGDLPGSGQVFTIPVAPGDVVIAGTNGLFDNMYNNEVTAVVVHAMRAGLGAQVTAQKIAALARQQAQDKNRQTPLSAAAQDAGLPHLATLVRDQRLGANVGSTQRPTGLGGKLDDITVVVSYITSTSNVLESSSPLANDSS